jgi:uncharacterized protein
MPTGYARPMEVVRFDDVNDFLATAGPRLLGDVARNNLILGITGTLAAHPEMYPRFHLWSVDRGGVAVGAALMTEPFNVVLAEPADQAVVDVLAEAVLSDAPDAPGVVGNEPWADRFAERWSAATGAPATLSMTQGVHALTSVRAVRPAPGGTRPATEADRSLLVSWLRAFATEALPGEHQPAAQTDRMLDLRLASPDDAGLWLWERNGIPVSLAGFTRLATGGARVGPVFTPPPERRRGFATALVAALSRWLLADGEAGCFLYTDLANPTSNKIYADIGYVQVCRSKELSFNSPATRGSRPGGPARER